MTAWLARCLAPRQPAAERYSAIVISDEEAAQVDRFRYVLADGCKEGLVAESLIGWNLTAS